MRLHGCSHYFVGEKCARAVHFPWQKQVCCNVNWNPTYRNPIVKATQKGRICHTPITHWLIYLLGLSLRCNLRLVLKLSKIKRGNSTHFPSKSFMWKWAPMWIDFFEILTYEIFAVSQDVCPIVTGLSENTAWIARRLARQEDYTQLSSTSPCNRSRRRPSSYERSGRGTKAGNSVQILTKYATQWKAACQCNRRCGEKNLQTIRVQIFTEIKEIFFRNHLFFNKSQPRASRFEYRAMTRIGLVEELSFWRHAPFQSTTVAALIVIMRLCTPPDPLSPPKKCCPPAKYCAKSLPTYHSIAMHSGRDVGTNLTLISIFCCWTSWALILITWSGSDQAWGVHPGRVTTTARTA